MKTQPIRALNRTRSKIPTTWDLVSITVGCVIMAFSFRLFTNGNHIVAGGVVGLSTLAQHLMGWEPALFQWAVNICLLLIGFLFLGKAEGFRSAYGSLVLPLAIILTRNVQPITHVPLLAAIFGGVAYGGGLGLVLQGRGSVGGYSLLARIAAKHLPVSVVASMFILDALTIGSSAWVFGFEMAMYGLIGAFIMRRCVESVLVGLTHSMIALIITSQPDEVKHRVLVDMDRGLTVLSGKGGYTGENRDVLMVVLGASEAPTLRRTVKECDPLAFVVLTEASEVLGRGFGGD